MAKKPKVRETEALELDVYFDGEAMSADDIEERYKEAKGLAGVDYVNPAIHPGTCMRRMTFQFPTDAHLENAKEALKDAGFTFFP